MEPTKVNVTVDGFFSGSHVFFFSMCLKCEIMISKNNEFQEL